MDKIKFNLQRFADVLHGTSGNDYANQIGDNTQVYGLAGKDSMEATGRKNVLLIGGSGDDFIHMAGGSGTLNGGAGADTFKLTYSGAQTISAVIEDINPTADKLIINYAGAETPNINYSTVGKDVVLTDAAGYFNVTLKGYREANDYFDGTAHENVWEVFKIVNQERESRGLNQLILSQGLNEAASIRSAEIIDEYSHTRPDGTSCFTAIKKSYSGAGENIYSSPSTPEDAMIGWMNSTGHRENILRDYFKFIGVGYTYDAASEWKYHWVQMFGGTLNETETVSTAQILSTAVTLSANGATKSTSTLGNISALKRTTLSGTSSADLLVNGYWYGEKATQNIVINALAGNDTISNSGSNSVLDGGDGNDFIHNGYYYYDSGGFYEESYNGDFDDDNGSSKVTISGGAGSDTIKNTGAAAIISGGNDNDSISNTGDSVTANGDSGNDFIINGRWYGEKGGVSVKLYGGAGNDTITNSGSNSVLDGGAGDDFIYNGYYFYENGRYYESSYNGDFDDASGTSRVTISGGAGNDSISNRGKNAVYVYSAGDGNDTISGYTASDTLKISGGTYSTQQSGSDILISVGSGSILLKNAQGKTLNIVGNSEVETETETSTIPAGISISGATLTASTAFTGNRIDLEDYGSSVKILNATALAKATSLIGNSQANKIFGGSGADSLSGDLGNDTLTGNGGNDIFVYSDGNDVIADYSAGDKIKLAAANIASTSLKGSDVIFKISDGSLTVKDGVGKNITLIDSSGNETTQNFSAETETLPAGISISGALLTATAKFTGNKIDVADYSGVTKVNASAVTKNISIVGSSAANSLKAGKGADTIAGGAGNDTVSLGAGADVYIYSAGNDLIQDYKTGEDKIKLASASISSASVSGSNVILKTSGGNITVKGAKDKNITVIDSAGNETSQVYPLETLPAGISISGALLTATAKFTGNKIDVADYSGVTKVNASAVTKNISIVGSSAANSLKAGKGADTISGGAGNDTVSLGAGADVYIYSAGNDLIQDYKTGEDKIKLSSASISSASVSGSNIILKTSGGNITVKGAKDKKITVIDSAGKETSQVYPLETMPSGLSYDTAKKVLTVDTSYGGAAIDLVDFASTVKTVDASSFSKKIKITGNNLGDSILGGKGADTLTGGSKVDTISGGNGNDKISGEAGNDKIFGGAGNDTLYGGAGNDSIVGDTGTDKLFGDAGNDTLDGGAGNDTLTGGDGKDVFVYSAGKDIIADYAAGSDKIKISSGSISSATYSGNNVVFKIGSGTLTVQDGKGKKITIVDANNKTTTQTYSGAVSGTSKLFADDNFISNETNLDAITEKNFAVTNLQPEEKIVAQDETFIAYGDGSK